MPDIGNLVFLFSKRLDEMVKSLVVHQTIKLSSDFQPEQDSYQIPDAEGNYRYP